MTINKIFLRGCLFTCSTFFALGSEAVEFEFKFPDFKVASVSNPEGPTGATVFVFPRGAIGAIDVRGGAAGLRESHTLMEENSWGWADAIVFAGGSTYGLEAASGVAREILKERKSVSFDSIPSVPAAIVYDFGGRDNTIFPDVELGARGYREAKANRIDVGAFGAGSNVSVGKFLSSKFKEKSGQGAAFYEVDGIKFFAFSVVNALGNILNRNGEVIRGSMDPKQGNRMHFDKESLAKNSYSAAPKGNTTVSLIITNAGLDRGELKRLAVAAHSSLARVIEPFQTSADGDTLFVLTTQTNAAKRVRSKLSNDKMAMIASQLLQDAVLNAIDSTPLQENEKNSAARK